MSRDEFTKATKREALKRSGGHCEATGVMYGLPPDTRCNAPLGYGVEFDHGLAASNGGDNSLENCVASCRKCHGFKTRETDTPRAAKTVRQRDKAQGIRGSKKKWPSRKFSQPRYDNTKYIERNT